MKKSLFALAIALSCYGISCTTKPGPSPAAQKNIDANRAIMQSFDSKDFSKLGDYIAEDAVDHAGKNGDIKGLAAMKTEFANMVANYDDQKSEVIKELADDEYVMCWARYTGTVKVGEMGYKAGDKYDMKAIEVAKFKDGKAIEHWSFMEPAEMMKMMGSMNPPASTPMPADSNKMAPMKKDSMK